MKFKSILTMVLCLSAGIMVSQTTRYVKEVATGTKDGSSWANASNDIQAMINASSNGDSIFVAKGTYKPEYRADALTSAKAPKHRNNAFVLKNGVKMYGGFDPDNNIKTLANARIFHSNTGTVLSGDYNGNDAISGAGSSLQITGNNENAFHVVISVRNDDSTILDGFTIKGGNANGSGSLNVSSNTIHKYQGAGLYSVYSLLNISNTTFTGNVARNNGAGMYIKGNSSETRTLKINKAIFSYNKASNGGGLYSHLSTNIIFNSIFNGNFASNQGGGLYSSYSSTIASNIFYKNAATSGGGIYEYWYEVYARTKHTITNSIFWKNAQNGSVNIAGADIKLNSTPTTNITYCLTQENSSISSGTGILNNIDPKFTNATNGNLTLQPTSPAIDAGNSIAVPTWNTSDLAGNPRQDSTVDMGAYEYVHPTKYVKETATGTGNGSSWANASNNLQAVINSAVAGSKIFVAKGTYKPEYKADALNGNKTPKNRNNAFVLKNGVRIYGGFDPDNGITDLSHNRILPRNGGGTILSGDFDNNDQVTPNGNALTFTNNSENAYHVLISVNNNKNTVLDGFTITGGNANDTGSVQIAGKSIEQSKGGGLLNEASMLSLKNIRFSKNWGSFGGGIYNNKADNITIINATFYQNGAGFGGAIDNANATPTIINAIFNGNVAGYGGAIDNNISNAKIINCSFYGNNSRRDGGAINNSISKPNIVNTIFWNNTKAGNNAVAKADIADGASSATNISYSITQENSAFATGTGMVNNQNPLFIDANNQNFRTQINSPAVNAGNNAEVPNYIKTDAEGNTRKKRTVDMGAFENILPSTFYVQETATGNASGSSWSNASNDLQKMINGALFGDKIFVAKGTYKPEYKAENVTGSKTPGNRGNAFVLKDGVQIYGGFDPANGITNLTHKRILPSLGGTGGSILSGDIDGDDYVQTNGTISYTGENNYHIIISVNDTKATIIDGFTVTSVNANYGSEIIIETFKINQNYGGGMYNIKSSPTLNNMLFTKNTASNFPCGVYNVNNSSPTITNSIFSSNIGAGMYNIGSSPTITGSSFNSNSFHGMYNSSSSPVIRDCTFSANTSRSTTIIGEFIITNNGDGGGMYNIGSSPTITGSTFRGNEARNGAGMYNSSSSPVIRDCTFSDNICTSGPSNGGGMCNISSSPTITASTFSGNKADYGAGISNLDVSSFLTIANSIFNTNTASEGGGGICHSSSSTTITNSVFYKNSSGTEVGGAIYTGDSNVKPTITNTIFWANKKGASDSDIGGGTPTVTYCLTQSGSPHSTGTGILNNQNPLFVNAANGDFRLLPNSPLINVGSNAAVPSNLTKDMAGNPRINNIVDIGAYENTGTGTLKQWLGTTNTTWATASNWLNNEVPSTTQEAVISATATNMPSISNQGITLAGLAVQQGATLTVNNGASLKVNGKATGKVTYVRNLGKKGGAKSKNWYLISAPVNGQDIDAFVTASKLKTGTNKNIALGSYAGNSGFTYYQSGSTGTGNFVTGKGHAVSLASTATGSLSFMGTLNTNDVSVPLTQPDGATGANFNLLGNPFTAYLNSKTLLENEQSNLKQQTIWLWNESTERYDTKVLVDDFKVAPGQGFFVQASTANNITFTKAMSSHNTADTFQKTANTKISVHLNATNGTKKRSTRLYYINGATKGFDNGYDGTLFTGLGLGFEVFTDLLDSDSRKYAVQSLPNSNIENMVVPVGIIAKKGEEITFSAKALNLPTGYKVYLEDKHNNVFANLSSNSYKAIVGASSALGQFYLHVTATALSTNEPIAVQGIHIFKSSNKTVTISGLNAKTANVKLVNLLGKEVFSTKVSGANTQNIKLSNLARGVYIVQLQTKKGKVSKKIIL